MQENNSNRAGLYRVFLWLFVIVVLIGAVFAMVKLVGNGTDANSMTTAVKTDILSTVDGSDWVRDNPNATTTLIEYGDFQCPACGAFYPLVQEIHKQFGSQIKFIFRHFPLSQHPNAIPAAKAVEAAGKQGKFWEMHDLLYVGQADWVNKADPTAVFVGYATTLKLDITKFKADMEDPSILQKINAEYAQGVKYNVEWTPTFFLNNTRLAQPSSLEEFKKMIQDGINASATK